VREGEGGILFPHDGGDKTSAVYGAIAALGHPRFGYVDLVAVVEEFRNNGIGTRLFLHVARQLYFDGIEHLVVPCPRKERAWLGPRLENKGFLLEYQFARDGESFYGRNVTGWNLTVP
jgi:ribosomal protein S18 acetylase RimI-like enzyme